MIGSFGYGRKDNWEDNKAAKKEKKHPYHNQKLAQDVKPVAVKNQENFFSVFLTLKMIFGEIFHFYLKFMGKLARNICQLTEKKSATLEMRRRVEPMIKIGRTILLSDGFREYLTR
jgi:hypothetical protein